MKTCVPDILHGSYDSFPTLRITHLEEASATSKLLLALGTSKTQPSKRTKTQEGPQERSTEFSGSYSVGYLMAYSSNTSTFSSNVCFDADDDDTLQELMTHLNDSAKGDRSFDWDAHEFRNTRRPSL